MKAIENEECIIASVADYIKSRWAIETSEDVTPYAAMRGDENAGREFLEELLTHCESLRIAPTGQGTSTACFFEFKKLLRRVLDVRMDDPANRKGQLPQAIGLVGTRDPQKMIRDRVVYFAFEYARRETGQPDRPYDQCAYLVSMAMQLSKNIEVSEENVKKIYERMLKEILGS